MLAFDHFRLDPDTGQCWRGKELVRFSPKAGAVLRYLVTHAGQLVSTADIRQAVWGNEGGSAAALKVCIGEIRKGLQDNPRKPRFIETHPRQGYRFIAPLTSSVPAIPSPDSALSDPLGATPARSSLLSLVGREAELRQLQQAFTQALQGERQFVFVSGEPGIGKTTLINAFVSQLAAQSEAGWSARGQCVEQYGAGEAYLPILEALGRLGYEAEGAEITPVLAQYAPTWLAQLPGLVLPAEREVLQQTLGGVTRERMLREMAEALEVLTTQRPVVLVLEDLHWSDQSTLELLGYILRRQGSARLLVLGTFRSTEVLSSDQSLRQIVQDVHGRNHGEEIHLRLLNTEQVQDYLRTQLRSKGALQPSLQELAQWVYGRTEGNPLFMVTLVEQLQREGVLIETETAWQIGEAWDQRANQVPDSLRQVIERQFESLSAAEQQVLAVASVVGTEFAVAAVAAGGEQAGETVEDQCGGLAARGHFIREAGIEEWPDGTLGGRYRFLHALYQDVLYDRVPEVRRVHLHRRIAERKAVAYGERYSEIAAELAMHFERGREYRRAIHYCAQAGQHAFVQRRANDEALLHLEKGCELLTHLPDSPDRAEQELQLLTPLSLVLMLTKGYGTPEAEATNTRALELCRQAGDTLTHCTVLYNMIRFTSGQGQIKTCCDLAAQLLEIAPQTHDPLLVLGAHAAYGPATLFNGQFRISQQHLDQAIALYNAQDRWALATRYGDDPWVVCQALKAWSLWIQGYPEQARAYPPLVIAYAEELGYPQNVAGTYFNGAFVAILTQDTTALQQWTAALERIAREQELPFWLAVSQIFQGWTRVRDKHPVEGVALIRQGCLAYQAMQAKTSHSLYLALLATACVEANQTEEGLSVITEALEEIETTHERFYEAELHRLKGEFLLVQEDKSQKWEEAEICFQTAITIARRQEAKLWELRAATSLGRLWQGQGKTTEARQLVEDIYNWFTEGFETPDLQEAEALLLALGSTVEHKQALAPPPPPLLPVLDPDSLDASRSAQPEVPLVPSQAQEVVPKPLEQPPTTPSATEQASSVQPAAAQMFRREGEYWTLVFAGQECRVKATQGMHYLAQLLGAPHHEFFAVTLASGNATGEESTPREAGPGWQADDLGVQAGLSDAGDVLDAQAQAAYKQRLAELQEELDEAQVFNDEGRAEKLQGEIDFLTQELAQAIGLGGRSRKAASSAERARVNVTRAIRMAIGRIATQHPSLGQYLQRTIKTGTACSYTPDSSPVISWQF